MHESIRKRLKFRQTKKYGKEFHVKEFLAFLRVPPPTSKITCLGQLQTTRNITLRIARITLTLIYHHVTTNSSSATCWSGKSKIFPITYVKEFLIGKMSKFVSFKRHICKGIFENSFRYVKEYA